MKLLKIPLHVKILSALVLGAFFGTIFKIDNKLIVLKHQSESLVIEKQIKDWMEFKISRSLSKEVVVFNSEDQIQIIKHFKSLSVEEKENQKITITYQDNKTDEFVDVISLEKQGTIASEIRPIGTIFIRLLSFLAIPLVIASLIVGAASIKDVKKLGMIGGKTFTIYMTTTTLAIIIGLVTANVIKPGEQISEESKNRLIGEFQAESSEKMINEIDINIVDFFVKLIPKNPIKAMAEGKMLQIVFFAVLFGITLTLIPSYKSKPVIDFFSGVSETMIKMVDFIMKIAPYGVFALISATIAEFGFDIITTLFWYIFAVLLGLLIQTIVVYPILVTSFGKKNPLKFFKAMRNAQTIGFSTSSSAATLPITMDCVENKLNVPKHISGFVLPLGATINMDGTALYQGVAAVFIAQVYGFDLSIVQQLTIVLTAVLASIGTAPVPGVGIIMLVMILQAIHVPPEGIALILGVDRVLDMCRTITNVTGDAAVAVAVAGTENKH